jgi:hypothetical protein
LRTLLTLTAILADGCYWLILPTIHAERFVRAVSAADYERADDCFRDPNDRFLLGWNSRHWHFSANAEVEPWSLAQLMRSERLVRLRVTSGDATVRTRDWIIPATRAGALEPQPTFPRSGVSGGGGFDVPLIPTAPTS